MSEQDNSQLDGTNLDTDNDLEINLEEEIEDDSQDELAKKDEIIKQLTARAKKAEAISKNFKNKEPKEKESDDIAQTVQELKLAETKRQFGYSNNLSPEETDYIFKVNPTPSSELLNDPFIKGGLDAIRKVKRVDANTPASGSRSPKFQLPKKEDLTIEDKQKAFEEYMASRKK